MGYFNIRGWGEEEKINEEVWEGLISEVGRIWREDDVLELSEENIDGRMEWLNILNVVNS